MSIGCGTGILAGGTILLLQRFISFHESYLLHGFSDFVMSETMLDECKRKTRDVF